MRVKHEVACPRCGFHVSDQGDAANPGLTGDVRSFTHTCEHMTEVLNSMDERPFGCPELLGAVYDAALPKEPHGPGPRKGAHVAGSYSGNGQKAT